MPSILGVTWIRERLHLQVDIRGPRTWQLCGDQARPCLATATGRPSVESLGKIISLGGNWDIQPVVIKYIWNISDRRINTNWVTHNHRPAVVSIVRTGAQVDTVLWWYIRYSQADNDTASPGYMCHMLDTLSLSSSSRMLTQWKHIQFSPAAEDL